MWLEIKAGLSAKLWGVEESAMPLPGLRRGFIRIGNFQKIIGCELWNPVLKKSRMRRKKL